jgi:hypothetical protein
MGTFHMSHIFSINSHQDVRYRDSVEEYCCSYPVRAILGVAAIEILLHTSLHFSQL